MARFDVYKIKNGPFVYFVDVQADMLSHLPMRAVIPLLAHKTRGGPVEFPRLIPVVKFKSQSFLCVTPNITSLRLSTLGKPIGNIRQYHHTITDAIDFLMQGF